MGFLDELKGWFGQVKERASTMVGGTDGLRARAVEAAAKAGTVAAWGVDAAASGMDRVTGGRYRDKIESVAGKVESALERDGRRSALSESEQN